MEVIICRGVGDRLSKALTKTQEQNNHYGPTKVGRLRARKEKNYEHH